MKWCPRCKTVKPVEDFGSNRAQADGLSSWCAECKNEHRRSRPADVKAAERRSWRHRNREQHLAQKALQKAVARGTVVRPDACESCGAVGPVQAHHDDYSLRFEVRWLCVRCHAATHMARVRVDMRLPEELVAAVDEARGDVSRTRFMERALEKALDDSGAVEQETVGASVRPASPRASEPYRKPFVPRPKGGS